MPAAARPYVMAGAALAAASVVVVTPVASRLPDIPIVSPAIRLVDSSLLNVPFNLFQDIVNIPYNEVQALDVLANSEFFTGPWLVVGATNLWGVDPGDAGHFMAVTDLAIPFPALSGMGGSETDFTAGLGQQLWGLAAAELPVNGACDAAACIPVVPTSPITGVTGIDALLWIGKTFSFLEKFPLIDNWFHVPLSNLLNGYTFDPSAPGSVDPSGPAVGGFGFNGTTPVGTGTDTVYAMPWSGETYTLEPWVPIQNFINSLMATPNISGFEIPTFTELAQALQAAVAGAIVNFDIFIPGSPFCPGDCILPASLTYPALVQDVSNLMPGNPIINEWLNAYSPDGAGVTYNAPTEEQILNSIQITQQGFWDFQNPSLPADWNLSGFDFSTLAPFFHQLWTGLGFNPPPLSDAVWPESGMIAPGAASSVVAGGVDSSTLSTDLSTLAAMFGASLPADVLNTLEADLSTLGTDLSAMLAPLGATLPADFLSQLPADLLSLL